MRRLFLLMNIQFYNLVEENSIKFFCEDEGYDINVEDRKSDRYFMKTKLKNI